jgi:Stress responsive A/B Barrel Domain
MIQHVMMMKFAAGVDEAHRAECVRRMKALPEQIDFLEDYTVGVDEMSVATSWDVGMLIRFESMEQLEQFRVHPAHRAAQKYSGPYLASMASVDFELAGSPAR